MEKKIQAKKVKKISEKSERLKTPKPSRFWCTTLWKEPSVANLDENFRYWVIGHEFGKTSGKEHWHLYTENSVAITMRALIQALDDKSIKCLVRRGTHDEARNYAIKDGDYKEGGKKVTQGCRTDLEIVARDLVSGVRDMKDIMEDNPMIYCQYRNGLRDIAMIPLQKKAQDFRHVDVSVLWGTPGSGKTREAMASCDPKDRYVVTVQKNQWWDGYTGQSTIIIDDYYGDWPWNFLLRVLDGYFLQLPVKGGFTYAVYTTVIMTSNQPPECWYPHERYEALQRRIKNVKEKHVEVPKGNTDLGL